MKTSQLIYNRKTPLSKFVSDVSGLQSDMVFLFGSETYFADGSVEELCKALSQKVVIGCSTAGEISMEGVLDQHLVVTAVKMKSPKLQVAQVQVESMAATKKAGTELGSKFNKEGLKAVFLLGRGLDINGSSLISGLREQVGEKVIITGGLAGDSGAFKRTFTVLNGKVADNEVVAVGFYGESLKISYGSMGGWEPFGPVRKITKSNENVLYELDGEPALAIYKKYLGDKAKDLPSSGLLYPFAVLKDNQDHTGLIRTILAVDEKEQSLTLAGDMPKNGLVRLMHTSGEGLVDGARGAALHTQSIYQVAQKEGLGILISCVGRKLVMGADTEDELDAVKEVLKKGTLTGFYSYGEICPQIGFSECKLHNQTMTITYFHED